MTTLRDAVQEVIEYLEVVDARNGGWTDGVREAITMLRTALAEHQTYHVNHDKSAAVATDYYYNHDMSQCPVGVKLLMLNPGNAMTVSQYNGKDTFWKGWAPCPKVRK